MTTLSGLGVEGTDPPGVAPGYSNSAPSGRDRGARRRFACPPPPAWLSSRAYRSSHRGAFPMPMRGLRCSLISLLALILAASPALAAPAKAGPGSRRPTTGLQDLPELKALKYRLVGPAWGGRVARVTGVPGDPHVYYAATASGGVWKSTDGGLTWKPDLRRPAGLLDRLDRRRAVRSQRRLRRLGRGEHPRQRRRRQRHLQVGRRRQDLEARLDAGGADRPRWSSTRRTPTSPSPPCSATPSAPTPSAASTAPPTAARPGSGC